MKIGLDLFSELDDSKENRIILCIEILGIIMFYRKQKSSF